MRYVTRLTPLSLSIIDKKGVEPWKLETDEQSKRQLS